MRGCAMTTAGGRKASALDATRARDGRALPASSGGAGYLDELDKYLDRLLDEALDETFPASDALALPTRRDVESK